ncbi:efflux transporter outer membrane subunit [Algibacter mikhailovii]|uniref:Membrane protein n=1 Tax=Algibacter mikhailovii TaxID=425498 RepID=A0A918VB43_9FLAO|nr:efflux transporter outer membrane subunit [Algibacter mikhailovii]GGZ87920.1 membrane protein [Algibacter mikhailovii]
MKKVLYILLVLAAFTACRSGKNYSGVDLNQPLSFKQLDTLKTVSYDSINTQEIAIDTADIRWWKLFKDPVLDTLIREAFANNRDALIAAENVLQARYVLKIQNADFLPKFSANGQVNRGNFLLNTVGPTSNTIIGSAGVYWEIDLWGKLRRLSESAKADLMATEYGYRGIMISLITEVATNYFDLLRARSQYEISKRNARSRDSMTQIIQARYDKGIVPMIDVDQAKIQYTIAAGAVPQYERQIVQLENSLSFLLGRHIGSIEIGMPLADQDYDISFPVAPPIELLSRRPDVIQAEYDVIAQNALTGAAKANRLPSLSLNGLVGVAAPSFSALSLGNPLWSIGGELVAPLFNWGQLRRQVDIEDSRTYQALYRYQNSVFGAIAEVENLLATIRTTKEEIEIANERRRAALEAQFLSRERYDKGVTSYLEFLEQQRQAFDAELLLENLRSELLSNYVRLYKALGGGWLNEAEEQASKESAAQENQTN